MTTIDYQTPFVAYGTSRPWLKLLVVILLAYVALVVAVHSTFSQASAVWRWIPALMGLAYILLSANSVAIYRAHDKSLQDIPGGYVYQKGDGPYLALPLLYAVFWALPLPFLLLFFIFF